MKKKTNKPRGLRNHNPLNIRHTPGNAWQGLVGSDGAFCIFLDDSWGYRAAFRLLHTYNVRYRLYSVRDIVSRWAPPSDGNNTSAYIQRVCTITGLKPADTVTFSAGSPAANARAKSVVRAMAMVENGCSADMLPMSDIDKGFERAF